MVKTPLPFYCAIGMLYQSLSFFVSGFIGFYPCSILLYVLGKLTALNDFPIGLCRGTLITYRTDFTSRGLVLFKSIVSCLILGLIGGQDMPLWASVSIFDLVINKVLCIIIRIRRLAGTPYCGNGHQSIYAQLVSCEKLTPGVIAFIIKSRELRGS